MLILPSKGLPPFALSPTYLLGSELKYQAKDNIFLTKTKKIYKVILIDVHGIFAYWYSADLNKLNESSISMAFAYTISSLVHQIQTY